MGKFKVYFERAGRTCSIVVKIEISGPETLGESIVARTPEGWSYLRHEPVYC